MPVGASADFSAFDEAIEWFLARIIMSPDQVAMLTRRARQRAWWIAGTAQANAVQSVFDSIAEAMKRGDSYDNWRKRIAPILNRAWSLRGGKAAHRMAVIYRNAVQHAYGRGRYEQMAEPAVKRLRPYWMFDAVMDSRTTSICRPLDHKIVAADHPWWDTHYPPLHHQCRSAVRTLRESDAKRRGIAAVPPTDVKVQDGFGHSPKGDVRSQRPDTSQLDSGLQGELHRKAEKANVA